MCAMQWVDNNDDGHFSPEMWQKGHLRTHWVRVELDVEKFSDKCSKNNKVQTFGFLCLSVRSKKQI